MSNEGGTGGAGKEKRGGEAGEAEKAKGGSSERRVRSAVGTARIVTSRSATRANQHHRVIVWVASHPSIDIAMTMAVSTSPGWTLDELGYVRGVQPDLWHWPEVADRVALSDVEPLFIAAIAMFVVPPFFPAMWVPTPASTPRRGFVRDAASTDQLVRLGLAFGFLYDSPWKSCASGRPVYLHASIRSGRLVGTRGSP